LPPQTIPVTPPVEPEKPADLFNDMTPTPPAETPATTPPATTTPATTPPAAPPPATTPPAEKPAEPADLFGAPAETPAATPPATTPPAETPKAETPPATPPAPSATDDLFGTPSTEASATPTTTNKPAEEPAATETKPAEPSAEEKKTDENKADEKKAEEEKDPLFGASPSVLHEAGGLASNELRLWKDNTGKFSCQGRLVQFRNGHVRLMKDNGRTTTVPLARLSNRDLEFVNRQAAAHQAELGKTAHAPAALPALAN
jgi:hypothetical protein